MSYSEPPSAEEMNRNDGRWMQNRNYDNTEQRKVPKRFKYPITTKKNRKVSKDERNFIFL